ncbi:MAG: PilZ domain-containing protein [Chloroflexia bacterium]|nr:PilZ domain-containing protein [Chloroflexia bacterium]
MSTIERRQYPRSQDWHLVSFTHYDEQGEVDDQGLARTLDMSRGGLLLEMTWALPLGSWLDLELQLQDEILCLQSQVSHVEERPNGRFAVGVAFLDVSEEILERIEHQIRWLMGQ